MNDGKKAFSYCSPLKKNEVFEIKKTSGLSEVVSKREAGFFPFFDRSIPSRHGNAYGDFGRETAWEKRSAQPY